MSLRFGGGWVLGMVLMELSWWQGPAQTLVYMNGVIDGRAPGLSAAQCIYTSVNVQPPTPGSLPPMPWPALPLCRELLVQWTTRDAGQPAARYGSSPDALAFTVPASSASYGAQDMCGPPASGAGFVDPGVLHTATLSGLRPGQQYWYQVGDLVRAQQPALCRCLLLGALLLCGVWREPSCTVVLCD